MDRKRFFEPPADQLAIKLFNASALELENFRADVERSRGLMLLLVHPYFVKEDPQFADDMHAKRTMQRTDKFIASESAHRPPIVILEENGRTEETARYVSEIGHYARSQVLMAPTMPAAPYPVSSDIGNNQGSVSPLIPVLKHLGVKKVLIGGMLLGSQSTTLTRCVGVAYEELKNDFETEISSFTYPLSRRDLQPEWDWSRKPSSSPNGKEE